MIAERLEIGLHNAKSMRELSEELGIDKRTVFAMIEAERRQGLPICASKNHGHGGYFLPSTEEEFDLYLIEMKNKIISESMTMQALQRLKAEGKVLSSVSEIISSRRKSVIADIQFSDFIIDEGIII